MLLNYCFSQLAKIYKNVIATGTSPKQLQFAAKVLNVQYICTSSKMSMAEIETKIGAESSVDLVSIAQAMHWFDLPTFCQQAKWLLKKPIAAWCYTVPEVTVFLVLKNVSMVFGFIEIDYSVDTAINVCKDLQGTVLDGHALILQLCHTKKDGQLPKKIENDKRSTKLLVRNVTFEATEKDLRQLFSPFGHPLTVGILW
ncbi:hypothetical protein A4A49_31906 [Nicotiana attenuata]|uniref:RRM domain-containing protein n=1 Tax=Nicotiana attenuata TaxID=49451 RepID=A0A1J6KKP4_NICAT|nr:hypothetical protein A4A49_31906 [Nicotiana attenuata]